MKRITLDFSPRHHLAISLLVLGILPVCYYFFSEYLPNLESLSQFVYFAAFVISAIAVIKTKTSNSFCLYTFIPLFCAFAFLEEIAYGAELFGSQPYLWEKYDVVVRDLHNFLAISTELLWLKIGGFEMLVNFLLKDLQIIGATIIFIVFARSHKAKAKLGKYVVLGIPIVFLLNGVLSLVDLAALPADPKNILLVGYSGTRLTLMIGVLILSILPLFIIVLQSKNTRLRYSIQNSMNLLTQNRKVVLLMTALLASMIAGSLVSQFYLSTIAAPWDRTVIERISPLINYTFGTAVIVWLAIFSWRGWLTYPIGRYISLLKNFFKLHPSFIYVLISLGLIGIAQVIDQTWIDLTDIDVSAGPLVTFLATWLEEGFELTAGFELILASIIIRYRPNILSS